MSYEIQETVIRRWPGIPVLTNYTIYSTGGRIQYFTEKVYESFRKTIDELPVELKSHMHLSCDSWMVHFTIYDDSPATIRIYFGETEEDLPELLIIGSEEQ